MIVAVPADSRQHGSILGSPLVLLVLSSSPLCNSFLDTDRPSEAVTSDADCEPHVVIRLDKEGCR
jgi:hypothetical protein